MSLPRARRILARTGAKRHGGRISSSTPSSGNHVAPLLRRSTATTDIATARAISVSSSSLLSSQRSSLIRHAGDSLAVASSIPRYFSSSFSQASDEQNNTTTTNDYNINDSNDSEPIVRGSVVVSREDERQEETKRKRLSEVRACVDYY